MGYLATLPGGKELMEADPNYWLDQKEWHKEDHDVTSLNIEYYYNSRSITPEICPPHHLGITEAKAAKDRARKAVGDLARLPAIKALLEGKNHGEDRTDPEYWRNREIIYKTAMAIIPPKSDLERARRHAYIYRKKLATFPEGRALLRNEDHGDLAADPKYWKEKKKYYYFEYMRLVKSFWDRLRPSRFNREETTLRAAMNRVFGAASHLSCYPEGRAILEAEDLHKNEDFKYWEGRRDYYRSETIKIEGGPKHWIGPKLLYSDDDSNKLCKRLESTFSRIKPPDQQFKDLSHLLMTPPRSPIALTLKKRAWQSSMAPGHHPMIKNASGIMNVIGCGKESNIIKSAIKNITNAGKGVNGRSLRNAGRHKSKNVYRHCTKGATVRPCHEQILA